MDGQDRPSPVHRGVPEELQHGDWLTIPLQTPFTWDPGQNLTVFFGADATPGAPLTWEATGFEFAAHQARDASDSGDPDTKPADLAENTLMNLKLYVTKPTAVNP